MNSLLAVLLGVSVVSAAPSFEASRSAAETGFHGSLILQALPRFTPGVQAGLPMSAILADGNDSGLFLNVAVAELSGNTAAPTVADLDLAALLNRHLKSQLKYTLGGKDVWVSGTFDRAQNAFVSVLVDGQEPLFFNVRGLLDKEESVTVGTSKYKLFLSPNVINKMKSQIVLENAANEDEQHRVTIKKLLEAVSAAGDEVKLSDQSYRAFYYDDIKNGVQDKTAKTLAFVLSEANGDVHVFLVPGELVPADQVAIFKMHNNKRVGLQQVNGRLKVFENP